MANRDFGQHLKTHAASRPVNKWGEMNCGNEEDVLFRISPDFDHDERSPLQIDYVATKNGDCLDVFWCREIVYRKDFLGERNDIEAVTKQLSIPDEDAFVDEWYSYVYEYMDNFESSEDVAVQKALNWLQDTLKGVVEPLVAHVMVSGYLDDYDEDAGYKKTIEKTLELQNELNEIRKEIPTDTQLSTLKDLCDKGESYLDELSKKEADSHKPLTAAELTKEGNISLLSRCYPLFRYDLPTLEKYGYVVVKEDGFFRWGKVNRCLGEYFKARLASKRRMDWRVLKTVFPEKDGNLKVCLNLFYNTDDTSQDYKDLQKLLNLPDLTNTSDD
jgi:hypothetical protein